MQDEREKENKMKEILHRAIEKKQKALSEYDSKLVVESAGVTITRERLAGSRDEAVRIAEGLGFPVVLKGCSSTVTHKTEMGMVKLNLGNSDDVAQGYDDIIKTGLGLDGVLVQEMIKGDREFVIGLTRDPQFGPCVMFGLGGIFTEVLSDVSFRVAPITEKDAMEMIEEIKTSKLLDEFRGSPAVDKSALITALVGIGNLGVEYDQIAEIDINPVIISGNKPVAVDALIVFNNS
ncbi:MAG: acetate--CoA ligase family protein [Thermodesulfobacteriota bacterium]|nr:acetate--CoA ligase family protein [Thermodesulfobacteriota bacterium]